MQRKAKFTSLSEAHGAQCAELPSEKLMKNISYLQWHKRKDCWLGLTGRLQTISDDKHRHKQLDIRRVPRKVTVSISFLVDRKVDSSMGLSSRDAQGAEVCGRSFKMQSF